MITRELLLEKGFEEDYKFSQHFTFYKKDVPSKINPNINYHLYLCEDSNTIGRDWMIQVDNERCMLCGSLDIQTRHHFNTFMDLLDLDFKI